MEDDSVFILVEESSSTHPVTCEHKYRRRRTTREAGHALEKLRHAIEYLSDEFVDEDTSLSARDGRIQAISILMALNHQVYFECPIALTFGEWLRSHLHRLNRRAGKVPDEECTSVPQATQLAEHHPF
jgi:hypothetical protein